MSNFLNPCHLISSTCTSMISVITTNWEHSEVLGSTRVSPCVQKGRERDANRGTALAGAEPQLLSSTFCTYWGCSQPAQDGPSAPTLLSQRCNSTSVNGCRPVSVEGWVWSLLNRNLKIELDFHASPLVQRHVREPSKAGVPLKLIRHSGGDGQGTDQCGPVRIWKVELQHGAVLGCKAQLWFLSKRWPSQGKEQLLP